MTDATMTEADREELRAAQAAVLEVAHDWDERLKTRNDLLRRWRAAGVLPHELAAVLDVHRVTVSRIVNPPK